MKKIYLAGPDVFFRNANAYFDALQARCAALGLRGVRPSDGGLSQGAEAAETVQGSGNEMAQRIYAANVALIRDCDAVLANLMPFRNPLEPDSGTVFEVGMAVALGKPVAGFVHDLSLAYEDKVARICGLQRDAAGLAWDVSHGFMIEEFGQSMNLMLSRSTALFGSAGAFGSAVQTDLALINRSLALSLPVELAPVGELVFVNLDVEFHDARLKAVLHIGHGLVVDQRAQLFQKETQQRAGRDVADPFIHVLLEVALDRRDGLSARFLGDFDGHALAPGAAR